MLFIFLVSLIRVQRSSLLASVIIIPVRIAVVIFSYQLNVFSRLLVFIYIMVFIGGLLVLLVRVASISFQEQAFGFNKLIVFRLILLIIIMTIEKKNRERLNWFIPILWFKNQPFLINLVVIVLLTALAVLTFFNLNFKGLIRRL